jgi:hypothetical protein
MCFQTDGVFETGVFTGKDKQRLRRSVQLKFGNDVTALNSNGYIYIQSYN